MDIKAPYPPPPTPLGVPMTSLPQRPPLVEISEVPTELAEEAENGHGSWV